MSTSAHRPPARRHRATTDPRWLPFSTAVLLAATLAAPASAIVWRNDITDGTTQDLARQGQFTGTGRVISGGSAASGVAIAPGWVLSARHFLGDGNRATFVLGGTSYAGTTISTSDSDVALIRLDANAQLPTATTFIAPNPGHDPLNQLIWKVGLGRSGPLSDSPNNLQPSGSTVRAGSNVINSKQNIGGGSTANGTFSIGPGLVFNNSASAANSTPFEVSTAPGDSGGPLMLQHDNQWFVAGVTTGAQSGVGFTEADVAARYDWIIQQTGDIFTPQTAPTELFWDGAFQTPGVQTGNGTWDTQRPNFTAAGFNYTWENDVAPVAVFGTPTTGAAIVQVDTGLAFSGIRFAPTQAGSGPFQLQDSGGALRPVGAGAFIDAQTFGAVLAPLIGGTTVTKTGAADLLLNGASTGFTGQLVVADGTLIVRRADALGTGGFISGTKTTVNDGATLQLGATGFISDEHLHLSGAGFNGAGALQIARGDHTLTERIALQADATVNTAAGTSVTFGGDQGRFYNAFTLTKAGAGTAVFDNLNGIAGLDADEGVVAGAGEISGVLRISAGAELRPGDSAGAAGVGAFSAGGLTLAGGGITLDLDPGAGNGDLIDVTGGVDLLGVLTLNLLSAPTAGDTYVFIDNDGTDAVTGTFANAAAVNAMFGGTLYTFDVTNFAGTGNDVGLSYQAIPEPASALLLLTAAAGLAGRRRRARA